MRALAQSGVTVLATIHSPSSEAFRRFDALLMLREGRVSYCGPLFGPNGAVAYFDRLGAEPHDPNTNLADYLISRRGDGRRGLGGGVRRGREAT